MYPKGIVTVSMLEQVAFVSIVAIDSGSCQSAMISALVIEYMPICLYHLRCTISRKGS